MPPQELQPAVKHPTILAGIMALISFMGFVDAAYLAVKWYTGGVIPCSIFESCDIVTKSVYGDIAGIPISLLGALYYLTILLIVIYYFDKKSVKALRTAAWLTIIGMVTSVILISIMAFVLKAYCLYCIISATTSTLLFISGMIVIRSTRNTQVVQ